MSREPGGRLVIISGPSGAGKSTVVRELFRRCSLPLLLSVSVTTRQPRPGEVDGVDYHFLSRTEFERRRDRGEFLECKEVFGRGDWYGTLQETVTAGLGEGKWVVLEIDVEGALSVLKSHPDAITVFVDCGSLDELERRLRLRGTETEDSVRRRLEVARRELRDAEHYRHKVVNDTVALAAEKICDVLCGYAENGPAQLN
jgi:guanylate kinase